MSSGKFSTGSDAIPFWRAPGFPIACLGVMKDAQVHGAIDTRYLQCPTVMNTLYGSAEVHLAANKRGIRRILDKTKLVLDSRTSLVEASFAVDNVVTNGKRGAVFFPFLDRWGRLGVTKMRWFSTLSRSAARGSTRCDRPRCGWVYQHSRHKPQSVEDREGW